MLQTLDREEERRQRLAAPLGLSDPLACDSVTTAPPPLRVAAPALWSDALLPHESVELLCDICRAHDADPVFRAHSPSLTAAEKDHIVAPARVQKTVTIELDGVFILCTAIGDATLSRAMLRDVAERLGLARGAVKRLHINPRALDPVACFEMSPGMVSPFLRPGRETVISAVVLTDGCTSDAAAERELVAVSLSLRWSLLIDAARFPAILREYARRAYPSVQWIDLRACDRASAQRFER